jgi:hypothetical protein
MTDNFWDPKLFKPLTKEQIKEIAYHERLHLKLSKNLSIEERIEQEIRIKAFEDQDEIVSEQSSKSSIYDVETDTKINKVLKEGKK